MRVVKGRQVYHLSKIRIDARTYYPEVCKELNKAQFKQDFHGVPIFYVLRSYGGTIVKKFTKRFHGPLMDCGYEIL